MSDQLKLGVNIDHVATIREVRHTPYPDVVEAARICEEAGASGITVHLREDRRHIQDSDVRALRRSLRTRLNLEMANAPDIIKVALDVGPDEVCIVPEKRRELTTEGGLDVLRNRAGLARTIKRLRKRGIEVSLFVEPDRAVIAAAREIGADAVELHTGLFCISRGAEARAEMRRLVEAARFGHGLGLRVNAGHGINMATIEGILRIPYLDTLNIGHSIISRAIMVGLRAAVREMLGAMARYRLRGQA